MCEQCKFPLELVNLDGTPWLWCNTCFHSWWAANVVIDADNLTEPTQAELDALIERAQKFIFHSPLTGRMFFLNRTVYAEFDISFADEVNQG
jgi:hypothetical protein